MPAKLIPKMVIPIVKRREAAALTAGDPGAFVVTVRVFVPAAVRGGALQLAPLGKPEQLKVTVPENPSL
jgi:hypothetical protein